MKSELCDKALPTCERCGGEIPVVYDRRRRQVAWLPWHRSPQGLWCSGYRKV